MRPALGNRPAADPGGVRSHEGRRVLTTARVDQQRSIAVTQISPDHQSRICPHKKIRIAIRIQVCTSKRPSICQRTVGNTNCIGLKLETWQPLVVKKCWHAIRTDTHSIRPAIQVEVHGQRLSHGLAIRDSLGESRQGCGHQVERRTVRTGQQEVASPRMCRYKRETTGPLMRVTRRPCWRRLAKAQ
jgi:hypothetical protein